MSNIGFSDFWSQQMKIKITRVHDRCFISSNGNSSQMTQLICWWINGAAPARPSAFNFRWQNIWAHEEPSTLHSLDTLLITLILPVGSCLGGFLSRCLHHQSPYSSRDFFFSWSSPCFSKQESEEHGQRCWVGLCWRSASPDSWYTIRLMGCLFRSWLPQQRSHGGFRNIKRQQHKAPVAACAPESKQSVTGSRHPCFSWLGVERLHNTMAAKMKIRKGVWHLSIWSCSRQKTRSCDPTHPPPPNLWMCEICEFFWHSRGWKNDSSRLLIVWLWFRGGERRKHSRPKQPGRNSPNATECRFTIGQKEEREAVRDGESHA